MIKYLLLVFVLFTVACATTHPGSEGKALPGEAALPMKVSAQTIDNAKGESFQLIEVTVENLADEWLRIHNARVVIDNPAESKLSIVLGQDLKDWAQAMELRLKKDEHNRELLKIGLGAAGGVAAVVGSQTNNPGVTLAGASLLLGTYAWAVTDVIRHGYASSTQANRVPENHLHQSFSVPGKMFLRRWVLINKPSATLINHLVIEFETVGGEKNTYEINL